MRLVAAFEADHQTILNLPATNHRCLGDGFTAARAHPSSGWESSDRGVGNVGSHDFGLQKLAEQWRIAAFRFNIKFVDGNLDLENAP
jgi:hypothetical protein